MKNRPQRTHLITENRGNYKNNFSCSLHYNQVCSELCSICWISDIFTVLVLFFQLLLDLSCSKSVEMYSALNMGTEQCRQNGLFLSLRLIHFLPFLLQIGFQMVVRFLLGGGASTLLHPQDNHPLPLNIPPLVQASNIKYHADISLNFLTNVELETFSHPY